MIRRGLFVAGVIIRKRQRVYVLTEYVMDTEKPLHTSLKTKTVSKEQLIEGMRRGIEIENVVFEDLSTKNSIKGTHGGLVELEVLSDGNIFGAVQYRYCLGVTDNEQTDGIIAAITCSGLGTGNVSIEAEVRSYTKLYVATKANIIKQTNFYVNGNKLVGKNHTLSIIDVTEISDSMGGNSILSMVKMQVKQADIMNVSKYEFDKTLCDTVKSIITETKADEYIKQAVRKFRSSGIKSVKLDYCKTYSNPARISSYQNIIDYTRYDKNKMQVKIAMALPPVDAKKVGYPLHDDMYSGYMSGDISIWDEIMLVKCTNGYILVDLITEKVMKAVVGVRINGEMVMGYFNDAVMDNVTSLPALMYTEAGIMSIKNSSGEEALSLASLDQFTRTRSVMLDIAGLSTFRTVKHMGLSKDGTKIVGVFSNNEHSPFGYNEKLKGWNRAEVLCDADYSLPGINHIVTRDIKYNVEYTEKLAKAFSEKAVSVAELAKRNKCSLLDGSTQSISTAFRTMQYDVMRLKSIVVDVGNGCKLYVGSDFKGITPEHNTFKLDLSKHEDRCKLRVLIETAKSGSRYYSLVLKDAENRAILMCKDESLGTINEATLDLISKLAKGDKKTIIGYSKVVSSDTLETCRRALLREMGANGIEDEAPSIGVAAILADVIAEYEAGYGFNFRVSGQHISTGLIVPLTFEVNSVNRQYFVSTETANCLKEAIKQNKKTVEIECKTFIEFIEASTFDLTN